MKLLDFIHQTKTQALLVFAILIGGALLIIYGHLSPVTEGRIVDLMYLGPSFYFIASKSGDKKDETIATLASNAQAALPAATLNTNT